MKELLTQQFIDIFFGISAPWFSWIAALILIIWPAWEIYRLFKLYSHRKRVSHKLISGITDLHAKYPIHGSNGLDSTVVDQLHQSFSDESFLEGEWNAFRRTLIYRNISDIDDTEHIWATESSANIFSEHCLLGSDFNLKHFHAIPGIVTGIGLLMTFAAILVGLLDVRIVDNKVHGLQNLIGGLSGKFVSSVAALFAATVFLIIEKKLFHNLNSLRMSIISSIDSLFPMRSELHIFNEISKHIAAQNNAFRTFNADLALKLRNSFNESMGPTLERMVNAIEDLNKLTSSSKVELVEAITEMNNLLKRSEQSRQDSITGQVETLLKDLQSSLSESFNRLSLEFSKSLTVTAQDQFSRVADTVGATAEILEGMNTQFTNTQNSLQELIALAKQSTESQFTSGAELINRMVNVLGSTIVQLEDKLVNISTTMANAIEGTAERSAEAAGSIISEVRNLNEQTVKKYVEVLQKHEEQLDRVDVLKDTLNTAVEEFGEYVTGYNKINNDLKIASKDISATMQLLSNASKSLKDGQESFVSVAALISNKMQFLAESNDEQRELWKNINSSMDQYKDTFESIEASAAKILSDISNHLQNFSRATQEHFEKTVTVANEHVNVAVSKLGSSIEELSDSINDLNDIVIEINKIHNNMNNNKKVTHAR